MLELDKKIIRELTAVETDFVAGGSASGYWPPETTDTNMTTYYTLPDTLTPATTYTATIPSSWCGS